MSKARLKLNEAKYFYAEMKKKFKDRKNEEFKHCINAFLSSARSVTWVMQKEFKSCEGFVEWYEFQREVKFKDENLKKFIDMRNISLKEEPINPRYIFGIMFDKGIKIKPGDDFVIRTDLSSYVSHQYKPSKSTKDNIKKENINNMKKANIIYSCMFEEIPGVNLFDISAFYLSVLEELVLECEKKFFKI
jgi:hypothetical protein